MDQIARALDGAGLQRAAICGVSFGGLIAAAFAARHPERVTSLVLVSALPPSWKLDERASFYLRSPRLFAPLFCLSSLRLYREIAAAKPGFWNGVAAALRSRRQRGDAPVQRAADGETRADDRRLGVVGAGDGAGADAASSPASRRWTAWCRRR